MVSNTETILESLRPTPIFITNFTGVRSIENVTSLVNSASAHKVFAGSDPFYIYSSVKIFVLLFFRISIVHSLALVRKKKCLYSWTLNT